MLGGAQDGRSAEPIASDLKEIPQRLSRHQKIESLLLCRTELHGHGDSSEGRPVHFAEKGRLTISSGSREFTGEDLSPDLVA
jgi:hypothetical protein